MELHGVPSLAASPSRGLVFGEAIDPIREVFDIDEGPFFVYAEALGFDVIARMSRNQKVEVDGAWTAVCDLVDTADNCTLDLGTTRINKTAGLLP